VAIDRRVRAVMANYKRMARNGEPGTQWATTRKRFTETSANAFFIGVLLDRQIPFARAWDGGWHMAREQFQNGPFWEVVRRTRVDTLRRIARTGFDDRAYFRFPNELAMNLKRAAEIIVDRYDGDVRKVWNVDEKDVDAIYDRLKEFRGIGDALAKMGQFALVREYGVAGGERSKRRMCVKPDVHVNRVTHRLGLVSSTTPRRVARELARLELESPADFDLSVWRIGQEYCHATGPACGNCPLERVCDYAAKGSNGRTL